MPDGRRNHEDRTGIEADDDLAGVDQERDLDRSSENMEQLLTLRVPLPRASLAD